MFVSPFHTLALSAGHRLISKMGSLLALPISTPSYRLHYSYRTVSEKRATDEDIQAISVWLSPSEFIDRHNEIRTSRAKATGRWFLESDKFEGWLEKRPSVLLCVGIRSYSLSQYDNATF